MAQNAELFKQISTLNMPGTGKLIVLAILTHKTHDVAKLMELTGENRRTVQMYKLQWLTLADETSESDETGCANFAKEAKPVACDENGSKPAPYREPARLKDYPTDRSSSEEPQGEVARANELARKAYERGIAIKQGSVPKSARAARRTKGELDGSQGIEFADGKLTVHNGAAVALQDDFPNVDLAAVCDRAAPDIAKFSYPSRDDAMTVLRKWARILTEETAKRSSASAQTGSKFSVPYTQPVIRIAKRVEENHHDA